jgi:hypothetical protein
MIAPEHDGGLTSGLPCPFQSKLGPELTIYGITEGHVLVRAGGASDQHAARRPARAVAATAQDAAAMQRGAVQRGSVAASARLSPHVGVAA